MGLQGGMYYHLSNLTFKQIGSWPDCLIFLPGLKILLMQIRRTSQPDQSYSGKSGTLPSPINPAQANLATLPSPINPSQANQAYLSPLSILLRKIRQSGKQRKFIRSLVCCKARARQAAQGEADEEKGG